MGTRWVLIEKKAAKHNIWLAFLACHYNIQFFNFNASMSFISKHLLQSCEKFSGLYFREITFTVRGVNILFFRCRLSFMWGAHLTKHDWWCLKFPLLGSLTPNILHSTTFSYKPRNPCTIRAYEFGPYSTYWLHLARGTLGSQYVLYCSVWLGGIISGKEFQ